MCLAGAICDNLVRLRQLHIFLIQKLNILTSLVADHSISIYDCNSREEVGEVGELAGPRAVVPAAAGQVGAVPAPRIWTPTR